MCSNNQDTATDGLSPDRLYAIMGGLAQVNTDDTLGGCGGFCHSDEETETPLTNDDLMAVAVQTFVHLTTSHRDCIALRAAECLVQISAPGFTFGD